ncbi:MAG: class I SAM-dependent methyltransferase [Propionibacteriaceae bacterium]|jgi:hypothetical protein|nr:class I SAM-dependent methyltransferase [Propionibacteriaceae bacterium]
MSDIGHEQEVAPSFQPPALSAVAAQPAATYPVSVHLTDAQTQKGWLVRSASHDEAIAAAEAFADPSSLTAATALRRRFSPDVAAWALTQVELRRKAAAKLGGRAAGMYLTLRGLEQATRARVSDWRAARMLSLGVPGVIDLTAGLGADAMAFAAAGLHVVAVERDPETASYLAHNLGSVVGVAGDATAGIPGMGQAEVIVGGKAVADSTGSSEQFLRRGVDSGVWAGGGGDVAASGSIPARFSTTGRAEVIVGDAVALADKLIAAHPDYAVYLDPSRRSATGRSWRLADITPPWEFVLGLLDRGCPLVVKLGPGFPLESIPAGVEACWVSDQGDLVELSLWPGTGRRAVALHTGAESCSLGSYVRSGAGSAYETAQRTQTCLYAETPPPELPAAPPRGYLIEPDPAVIRSGLAALLGEGLTALSPGIAYLSSDEPVRTPLATCFEVCQRLPYREADMRAWVREHRVGIIEIKCRGVKLDPASLRRKLRAQGPNSATFIISPTVDGTRVFVVQRAGTRLA